MCRFRIDSSCAFSTLWAKKCIIYVVNTTHFFGKKSWVYLVKSVHKVVSLPLRGQPNLEISPLWDCIRFEREADSPIPQAETGFCRLVQPLEGRVPLVNVLVKEFPLVAVHEAEFIQGDVAMIQNL